MIIHVRDTLDRKYMHPGKQMIDPYTEDRDGHLYLVSETHPNPATKKTGVLCEAIVSIEIVEETA